MALFVIYAATQLAERNDSGRLVQMLSIHKKIMFEMFSMLICASQLDVSLNYDLA